MNRPTPDEMNDTVVKAATREVKASLAANGRRPLTKDEELVLQMGILAGSNSMVQELARLQALGVEMGAITGQTSDGYHTFDELYRFRLLYNAALFRSWSGFQNKPSGVFDVHKSWRHHDGEECFGGGWFIVMATLPTGQISNHYEAGDWDLFDIPERERADEWDGHTAADVAQRLESFLRPQDLPR